MLPLILAISLGAADLPFTDFPIGASLPPAATKDGYAIYRMAGFNLLELPALDSQSGAIKLAVEAHLSVILAYPDIHRYKETPADWVKFAEQFPNVVGWRLRPGSKAAADLAKIDPGRLICPETRPRAPFLYKGGMEADGRAPAGLGAVGGAFWGLVQSAGYDGFRTPSESDLFWQVNTLLSNSAKGLWYQAYMVPKSDTDEYKHWYRGWDEALYNPENDQTMPLHAFVERVNAEAAMMGRVLMNASRAASPSVQVELPGRVVEFSGKDGNRYLLVMNDLHGEKDACVDLEREIAVTIERGERLNMQNSKWEAVQVKNGHWTVRLGGGCGVLLRLPAK